MAQPDGPPSPYQLIERLGLLLAALRAGPTTLVMLAGRTPLYDAARPKTLQRDIAALRHLGFRIAARAGRYELLAEPLRLDLSVDEARVLAALRAAFPRGHPDHPAIEALIERLRPVLSPAATAVLDEPPPLRMALTTAIDYKPHRPTLRALQRALDRGQRVRFEYQARDGPPRRYRTADPVELHFTHGHFYLIAYIPEIERTLEFRVDRIALGSLQLRSDRAAPRPRPSIHFTYRLAARIARHGVSERFANQRVEPQADGSALVHAEGPSAFRIIQELLHYGEQAELLEPEWLRLEMARTIERMVALYRDSGAPGGPDEPSAC
ncbi:MAG: WYL domain-containing protein [Ardenticatenaceae bacterium]|nr:WYL domain-containing protein [Ardenticatenaceae bacterium]